MHGCLITLAFTIFSKYTFSNTHFFLSFIHFPHFSVSFNAVVLEVCVAEIICACVICVIRLLPQWSFIFFFFLSLPGMNEHHQCTGLLGKRCYKSCTT